MIYFVSSSIVINTIFAWQPTTHIKSNLTAYDTQNIMQAQTHDTSYKFQAIDNV